MKVLYLTLESYRHQAIIQSQVISLFKSIFSRKEKTNDESPLHVVLTTFDPVERPEYVRYEEIPLLEHVMYKHRGTVANLLFLVYKSLGALRNADIVHVRSYLPMIPALLLKFFFGKKLIFDMRGLLPEETLLRKGGKLQFKLLYWLEVVAAKYADRIVVVSDSFKEVMLKRRSVPDNKIVVIPTFSANSIKGKPSAEVPNLREAPFIPGHILFVYSGAYEKWQCADEVVAFFKVLNQQMPAARFVVLSKNVEEFTVLLKQHFQSELFYVRNARNEDLYFYLRQCDYGILFRKPHIINQVAAPIKFKDYLSAGLPVVATTGIGDYSKHIRDCHLGIIIETLDPPGFEKAVSAIKDKKDKFEAERIQETANQLFDVSHAAGAYLNLYINLIIESEK